MGPGIAPGRTTLPLACATVDAGVLLDGRLTPIFEAGARMTGYVLNFADISRDIAELARRDGLLQAATEELRAPLGKLRDDAATLAAELAAEPGPAADRRRTLAPAIRDETAASRARARYCPGLRPSSAAPCWSPTTRPST